MLVFERFMFILIGIALVAAALLGGALYYHFSRFSPDRRTTAMTMIVYASGIGVFALCAFIAMIF